MSKEKVIKNLSLSSSILFLSCSILLCFHSWCTNFKKETTNIKTEVLYNKFGQIEKKIIFEERNKNFKLKNNICNIDFLNENDVFYIKIFMFFLVLCFLYNFTEGEIVKIISLYKKIKKNP